MNANMNATTNAITNAHMNGRALIVAIIGAGPLGRWLAARAAQAGFKVLLEDVMPLNLRHAQEALRLELGPDALPNVTFVSTVEDAVRHADLVVDCVPDELESKLEIFCLLDRMAPPRTVFITPTTRLSIADLASCTYRAGQCVSIRRTAASLTSSVDLAAAGLPVCITSNTTPETLALVIAFWKKLGCAPSVERDAMEEKLHAER